MAVQAQQQAPELLTYQELVQLYEQETPPDALQNKLRRLLTTPFVSNEAAARGVKPLLPTTAKLGRFLRVVSGTSNEDLNTRRSEVLSPTRKTSPN